MVALRTFSVALVGNPNTGKTTLFNALAGMNQRVGNYPGVTVETKRGKCRSGDVTFDVIDLPGTYSLAPRSPDEMVAVEVILGQKAEEPRPDAVVAIVDASNLDRNLYLVTQVMEVGLPVIVALNMADVAEAQGIRIDIPQLSRRLGLPVIPIQANKSKGLEELKRAMAAAMEMTPPTHGPHFPEAFDREAETLRDRLSGNAPIFLARRLLLDVGGQMEISAAALHGDAIVEEVRAARQRLSQAGCPIPAIEARTRYAWIRQATAPCIQRPKQRAITFTDQLDKALTHRFLGTFIFLAIMFLVFQAIYAWAEPFKDRIVAGQKWIGELVQSNMEPGPLRSLLSQGVVEGVGSVVVFLPQILLLFAVIAFLEDCGYMARAAFLMDRLMSRAGLNGKSFIPLLSSMACAVPGIMAARVIENRRDRFATIMVAPLMSCSARLPVYILLAGAFLGGYGSWAPALAIFLMYCLGLVVAPLMALLLKRTLLRGETPAFVMEMPLYKLPSIRAIAWRSFEAGWMFVRRAGTIILATMILIWAMLYFPTIGSDGTDYAKETAALEAQLKEPRDEIEKTQEKIERGQMENADVTALEGLLEERKKAIEPDEAKLNHLLQEWKGNSILGRMGRAIEPAVRPLGWDWRIAMSALASFPAREVMVGTLGIVFDQGEGDAGSDDYQRSLGDALREATWPNEPERKLFTIPTALSIMVFFALCCQCVSTLAVIRRETASWTWPAFTFAYMTVLAYVGALATYQIGRLFL
ncbi:MAG: ferrous iron transport protein B [Gemmataceae bacterium]|nr:ferrous iron transport protein B [Gemmataceae bacterium]